MTGRRFPPPCTAEQIAGGYVVKDATGQSLAYVVLATAELTIDEARRIAANIAKLPTLLLEDKKE